MLKERNNQDWVPSPKADTVKVVARLVISDGEFLNW
jgi:hypothetical protein